MSRAKELLEQATPRPWTSNAPDGGVVVSVNPADGRWQTPIGSMELPDNAALIVYAVNRLADYEAAVEVLADVATRRCESYGIAGDKCRCDTCRARAALGRLRDEVMT